MASENVAVDQGNLCKALFLGFGNMGKPLLEPFVKSFIRSKRILQLCLVDLQVTEADISYLFRGDVVGQKLHGNGAENLQIDIKREIPKEQHEPYEYVFFAVKPQIYRSHFVDLSLPSECTVVSCMAGISTDVLCHDLGVNRVFRFMPNLAIQNGNGFVGYFQRNIQSPIITSFIAALSSISDCHEVKEEELLNDITSLMGSGPALVATFIDACLGFALDSGFSQESAEAMVNNLVRSTLTLLEGQSPSDLCTKVASKGGTTEAMLRKATEENLIAIVKASFKAARSRARELAL